MTDTTQAAQFRGAAPKAGTRISRDKLKRTALALGVIAGVFAAAAYGHYYWTTGRYLVSTDDAYIDVHSAMISPKMDSVTAELSGSFVPRMAAWPNGLVAPRLLGCFSFPSILVGRPMWLSTSTPVANPPSGMAVARL